MTVTKPEYRGPDGRFLPGNPGGPGNPFAARVGQLRAALLDAVTPEDIREVVKALVQAARRGSVPAAKVLFERVLGQPEEAELTARIEELEAQIERLQRRLSDAASRFEHPFTAD